MSMDEKLEASCLAVMESGAVSSTAHEDGTSTQENKSEANLCKAE